MKKRARKIQVWLACVFAVILLWNLGQVEAKASTAQEDNLVIIYGVNAQGEAEMASNGLLISSSKGKSICSRSCLKPLGADGQILCRRSGSRAAGN